MFHCMAICQGLMLLGTQYALAQNLQHHYSKGVSAAWPQPERV
jgi:hypothetical protein